MSNARDNIRMLLCRYHLTYAWLINELERTRGIKTRACELSDIMRGARKGRKADTVIAAAHLILKKYGEAYYGDA